MQRALPVVPDEHMKSAEIAPAVTILADVDAVPTVGNVASPASRLPVPSMDVLCMSFIAIPFSVFRRACPCPASSRSDFRSMWRELPRDSQKGSDADVKSEPLTRRRIHYTGCRMPMGSTTPPLCHGTKRQDLMQVG